MCEPVSITMGVMAAGAAVTSIVGANNARQAAKGTEENRRKSVESQIAENRRRATADYIQTVRDEQLTQRQEEDSVTQKIQDQSFTERAAASTAKVSAAERGVSGQSLALIDADYRYQTDVASSRLQLNQDQANYQHKRNIQNAGAEYNNRASSLTPYIPKPQAPVDYLGPIFQAGGQAMSGGVSTGAFKKAGLYE